ncbi:hypothetical protein A0256_19715 [Mucilaginibacter sp. PAMC 26640]|nr:hypothetical protein A0256_19715 [Mucilaginibacter sp. PAMC 26640]
MKINIVKSFLFLSLCLVIASCKLDPVVYPINKGIRVKYQVNLNTDCACSVTFADSLNYDVTAPLTSKLFETTFKVTNKDYFKTAYIKISSNAAVSQASGTANIYVNGLLKATKDFVITANSSSPIVSYTVKH